MKKKQQLKKKIYLDYRNLQVFINFPAMANANDGDQELGSGLIGLLPKSIIRVQFGIVYLKVKRERF